MIFALKYSSLSDLKEMKREYTISSVISDKTFRFISADKSDQFVPKISKVTSPHPYLNHD